MSASAGRARTPKPSTSSVQRAAVATALTCRAKKVKCSGTVPCQYCSRRSLPCSINPHGPRRVYSANKIAELESRLERYEERSDSAASFNATSASSDLPNDAPQDENPISQSQNEPLPTPGNPTLPQFANSGNGINSQPISSLTPRPPASSVFAPEPSLSSSNRFGRKVQEVLTRSGSARSSDVVPTPSPHHPSHLGCSPRVTAKHAPQLPNEDEAFRLLEAVSLFIGQSQSHYDSREISDRLWYIQVIIILAIGKLYAANFEQGGHDLLGQELFGFAQQSFPSMSVQYANGRLGVELNALMAMYLQMMDRKEEAHLYITSALRLATLHGYHRENARGKLLRSEKAQINRLWWTVYMQERRLAAATGTPSGINDDAIDLPLPWDASGFPPAAAIRANIRIARVTGKIITNLYGTKFESEEDFVSNAQQIIKNFFDISTEIPSEQFLNLAGSNSNVSLRTAASLHLMLYQTALLAIRPLMLRITQRHAGKAIKDVLRSRETDSQGHHRPQAKEPTSLTNLAVYGFFECDAIFSAVFIMLLTKIFDSSCKPEDRINPSPGLQEAMDMLQYLADRGNIFARERFREVQGVWDHLSATMQVPESQLPSTLRAREINGDQEEMRQDMLPSHEGQSWGTSMWNNHPAMWLPMDLASDGHTVGSLVADLPLEDAFHQYQSLFNDPNWTLTGQDVGDFAELRRHVFWLNP
ncbi:uncharacterized protein NECHADRAFT_98443 [Fusarium vanettenii 77-13-4]|uniref:Zn(2)-C6 fungal-type domain-containing protein n=1 Tax=Fusarium vanettenii (strain ATCC MYA-4622 / CBS 123669 / FGSC 9596 / NRRL 45880 / 77-13-4) TaxID=660122 RepID=C7ZR71_FUSV7|nr:uncharacterized protein NECHADRAFT_98443 [Fusarium vanettenii 77-13-4]EEU33481.1 hypothetical protein NECHADRAFT_98443 [Fusarium vanettenii 77-13-4]